MANWNLSVELRGEGNDLAKKLRKAATGARDLGAAARDTQDEIKQLGTTAGTTGKAVKKLGTASETATGRLALMAAEAKSAAKDLRKLEQALADTDAQIRAMADRVRITAELDDQTTSGMATIRAALDDLRTLSPVDLYATLDDRTGTGVAAVRAALADLERFDPVSLGAQVDDQTSAGVATVRASMADLQALGPVRMTADFDDQTSAGIAAVRAAVADLELLSPVRITAELDDQTGPGMAAVRGSIADLERQSPVLLNATIDDNTSAGVATVRAAVADLQALGPVDITARFDGDTAQLAAAATAVGELRDNASNANTALDTLATRSAAVVAALNQVQQEAQDASRALRTLRGRAAAAAAALDELGDRARFAANGLRTFANRADRAGTNLTTLSGNTRTLRGDLDDLDGSLTRVTGRMGGLRGSLGSTSTATNNASKSTHNLIQGAILLGSALIPIAAAIVPIATGLGAAGVAIGMFGAAVGGQIKALTEVAEAEEKYEKAVREHGAASTEAAKAETEYLRQVEEMPPASREAAAALSVLKDEYGEWSDALAGDTMPVVTKSMGLFTALLPKTTGLVKGTSAELDNLMNVVAGGMSTPGFDRFVASFTQFATGALSRGTLHLVEFTQALDTGEIGSDLREFLDYARANGPLVGDTLKNLATAVTHLLVAMSDVGVSVLSAVDALAKLVNAIPTGFLSTVLQLYAGLKLVTLGVGALGTVTGSAAVARLGAYFAVMRAAGVSATLRATAASMSAMTKATIGLGVLAVAAIGIGKLADKARGAPPDIDRLTTSLKKLAVTGKMSGELKATFGGFDGLVDSMKAYQTEAGKAKEASEGVFGFRIPVLDDIGGWFGDKANDMAKGAKSLNALKEDFKGVDEALAQMAASGSTKEAAAGFNLISKAGKKAGWSTKEIAEIFPKYKDALSSLDVQQQLAAAGMGVFGQQALEVGRKLDTQKQSADGLRASIIALNDTNRSAYDSQIAFEESIDSLTASFKKNGSTLDISTDAGRKNGTAMSAAAKAHDEMIAAGLAAGESLGSMTKKSDQLRGSMMRLATDAFDGNKKKATEYVNTLLGVPGEIKTAVKLEKEEAVAGLLAVQAEITKTPGAKTVKVDTLNAAAIKALEAVGYKTRTLPDGRTEVFAKNGQAIGAIGAVSTALKNLDGKTATVYTRHHYINLTENRVINTGGGGRGPNAGAQANGSVLDFYVDGGLRPGRPRRFADGGMENHVAQIAPAGDWRVWAEDETGGESYIPLAVSKRPRSRAIAEETVRRLGGDPESIQWNAAGGVTDWRYDPNTGSLYSPTDAGSAGHKTRKVKGKEVSYFDLGAVEKRLKSTAKATTAWNRDLQKIADLAGGDVAEALASMGKDGIALTHKMATGSTKYLHQMAAALRGLAAEAKASLSDYTRQLTKATGADTAFTRNLAILAARGYGDLAKQLAAQGDTAAQQLASAAVGDSKKASAANKAAGRANGALTGDQVEQLVAIIAAVKTSKTGIHDVAATTGIGEDIIITVAGKASSQIRSALGSRSARFMADLARGQRGLSYASGGIREGIYATRGGAVTFAEPETGGEAYIPLGAAKRRAATNVLKDVAGRFGVGLTDMAATRPVVIVREAGDTHVTVTAVRTGASASDIGSQVGRSVRRARRGGVNARAAA